MSMPVSTPKTGEIIRFAGTAKTKLIMRTKRTAAQKENKH